MATFPHNLCGIRQDGHAEQHTPVVLRSEVERGMPRQRRTSADALVTVPCTLVFRSAAAAAEFEAWYYAEGFGWFDFTLPRTGTVVEARIVGGDIGGLTPITPAWNASERSIAIEYRRPGFVQLPPGLHSVNPARIMSVQRNSTATYVDDAGVLQTAAANVARYEGGQVLVEPVRTNLLLYPSDLGQSVWVKQYSTEVYDPGAGSLQPDGQNYGAWALFETNDNSLHNVYQSAVSAGRAFSAFVKAGPGMRYVALWGFSSGTVCGRLFDLQDGVARSVWPGSGQLTKTVMHPVAGGWWRIGIESDTAFQVAVISLCNADVTGETAYFGSPSRGAYVWGCQHEADYITSYTPATRAADIITVAA